MADPARYLCARETVSVRDSLGFRIPRRVRPRVFVLRAACCTLELTSVLQVGLSNYPMPKRTRSEFEDEEVTHSAGTDSAGDDPILSHAEKRSARKRQKKAVAATDAPSKPARGFSVWVGNLNWKTRPQALKAFFADVGEATRVHLPPPVKALHGNVASNASINRG